MRDALGQMRLVEARGHRDTLPMFSRPAPTCFPRPEAIGSCVFDRSGIDEDESHSVFTSQDRSSPMNTAICGITPAPSTLVPKNFACSV